LQGAIGYALADQYEQLQLISGGMGNVIVMIRASGYTLLQSSICLGNRL